MLNLMQKRDIILKHYMEGKSQWQIFKETGIDRKTIRKYTREYEKTKMELSNDNSDVDIELIKALVSAPKYDSSNRSKIKLTDTIIDKIGIHLKENEDKRATGRSKQQKKKIDIYEALVEEYYNGTWYLTILTQFLQLALLSVISRIVPKLSGTTYFI